MYGQWDSSQQLGPWWSLSILNPCSDCYRVRGRSNIEGDSFFFQHFRFSGKWSPTARLRTSISFILILRWGHCHTWRFGRCSLKRFSNFSWNKSSREYSVGNQKLNSNLPHFITLFHLHFKNPFPASINHVPWYVLMQNSTHTLPHRKKTICDHSTGHHPSMGKATAFKGGSPSPVINGVISPLYITIKLYSPHWNPFNKIRPFTRVTMGAPKPYMFTGFLYFSMLNDLHGL